MQTRGKMVQGELFDDKNENLFERLCSFPCLRSGFKAVKANGGSPGIDGITIKDFESRLEEELAQLRAELLDWSYKPSPVRKVEIPKPNGGIRVLGVPCLRDRVVQAGLKQLLEPIFDPTFSKSSYGFRPGKNQKEAIESAKAFVQEGKEFVVDIDLSKFFDRINHDRLIHRVRLKVQDKRILRLIGTMLRSGISHDGNVESTLEGTTQGSPLSPLLSNIVLDEMDKELESRGLSFCRFADDCNIFVSSQKAADRVMVSVTKLLEKKMKLVVNQEKSKVDHCSNVKFLGMTIIAGVITLTVISSLSMNRAMEKLKELIPQRSSQPIEKVIADYNQWYRGWSSYYEMTSKPQQFKKLESHARRRMRSRLIRNLKRPKYMVRFLKKNGANPRTLNRIYTCHKSWWALSHDRAFEKIYSNHWFQNQGMFIKSNESLEHWV